MNLLEITGDGEDGVLQDTDKDRNIMWQMGKNVQGDRRNAVQGRMKHPLFPAKLNIGSLKI